MVSAVRPGASTPSMVAARTPKAGRPHDASELAAMTAIGRPPRNGDPSVTKETASKLLSQLFFAPMLAEMRKSSCGARFANGGRTEAIFGEQLDLRIADAVARSGAGGVTDQVVAQLSGGRANGAGI